MNAELNTIQTLQAKKPGTSQDNSTKNISNQHSKVVAQVSTFGRSQNLFFVVDSGKIGNFPYATVHSYSLPEPTITSLTSLSEAYQNLLHL